MFVKSAVTFTFFREKHGSIFVKETPVIFFSFGPETFTTHSSVHEKTRWDWVELSPCEDMFLLAPEKTLNILGFFSIHGRPPLQH